MDLKQIEIKNRLHDHLSKAEEAVRLDEFEKNKKAADKAKRELLWASGNDFGKVWS